MAGLFDNIFAGSSGLANTLLNLMGVANAKYYRKNKPNAYDPLTPILERDYDTGYTITDVTVSPPLNYSAYEKANSDIQKEDCKAIGKGFDFPDIQNTVDKLEINGIMFVIVNHKKIYSGEQLAAVNLQLRRENAQN